MTRKTPLKGSRSIQDCPPEVQEVLTRPSVFARRYLKMALYPKQEEIIDALADAGRVTCRTCNESGKTQRMITALILWHIALFPRKSGDGGVITTSGSWNQVKNQLVPALRAYSTIPLLSKYEFMAESISLNGYPQWIGFATNNVGASEGFHGSPEKPLLAIVDEAKSVPDEIIDAIDDRVNPQRFGMFSSPGSAEGRFYQTHSKLDGYKRFKVPASECPHIDPASIERRIKKHGIQSPIVQSMIFAEFMELVEGAVLTMAEFDRCVANPPAFKGTDRHCFCDFAAGGDENVIALRVGNRVRIVDAWTDTDTMAGVGRFVRNFVTMKKECGLRPEEIEGDADGMGKPMVDRLHEVGWPIGFFHGGHKPRVDDHHANLIAEVWMTGADKIKEKEVLIDVEAAEMDLLRVQITNRKTKYNSSGKLALESKPDMRNRGVGSPDRADALLGALAPGQFYGGYNFTSAPKQEGVDGDGWYDKRVDEDTISALEGAMTG